MWLGNVFARERAERLHPDDLARLFHRIPEMDQLERPANHIVLGIKGTGKSTALKALTPRIWKTRTDAESLPFTAVYIPMGYDEVAQFLPVYNERQYTALFEHYLVSTVLAELCDQWRDVLVGDAEARLAGELHQLITPDAAASADFVSLRSAFGKSRRMALNLARGADPEDYTTVTWPTRSMFAITYLRDLSEIISETAVAIDPSLAQLGVLFDSFDYYQQLGSVVAPLLESDHTSPLLVKLAARSLHVGEVFAEGPTRTLEPGRDYHSFSLDRNPDDPDYLEFVRHTLWRRVTRLGPDEASELTPDEVLSLLFAGSTSDKDAASFESYCRVSSGNVLTVIELLNGAAAFQLDTAPRTPAPTDSLLRDARLASIEEYSDRFWNYEIEERMGGRSLEAVCFCDVALQMVDPDATGGDSPVFVLEVTEDLSRPLVHQMLARRVLIASDPLTNRKAQSHLPVGSPVHFELNRALLPGRKRVPTRGNIVHLDRTAFATRFRKALREAKPRISPRSDRRQKDLFRSDFHVFLSVPFDPNKKGRSEVVKRAVNQIYRELTGESGGPGISYTDVFFIPKTGPFRQDIPKYIQDATYLVADITDIGRSVGAASGVFYELGLATAYCKPFALFYNSRAIRVEPFSIEKLPKYLRGHTVLVWQRGSGSFREEFRRVHERLAAHHGRWEHPFGSDTPADPQNLPTGPYAYLSFQPRHARAEAWFSEHVHRLFPRLQIIHGRTYLTDEGPLVASLIQGASVVIVDCTSGVNEKAIELGIAAAFHERGVIEVWDQKGDPRINPISMYPGHRLSWTGLNGRDADAFLELLERIARWTDLGTQS